ncbi:thiamine phosphate synthase [Curvibacter sp. PAE-UM]|uniref:thiamine phosphate synthase n=1 Tax=Curvibacter sp. PAE-UM TaxID=1714344 RepID=UPI000710489E|nr:thiamine phosphate synthase [Curvibacter sp. PAE-UM]KRI00515.1 thiamine-phosphate diphosphorylase [Curvibacter sp. PAE-UM]
MTQLTPEAQAIVAAHPNLALPVVGEPALNYSRDDAVYRHAKQACLALGFIEIDAESVALAWLAQAQRTGRFDPQAWPDEPVDFGLRPWPRADAFAACPKALGLYAVLPDAQWVGRVARAGVPTVQLRFKSDDAAAVLHEVEAAVQAVRGTPALLFINDHWREAIAAGAYGVHLGQEDMEIADFAAIRAAGLRLGLSSHGYAEMVRADRMSPSYLAMGAVYPTTLKRMATAAQGPGRLAAYARLMRNYPGVGIGGISAAELPEIKATGVGSLAVVRAITAETDPEQAAARLMAAWAA